MYSKSNSNYIRIVDDSVPREVDGIKYNGFLLFDYDVLDAFMNGRIHDLKITTL